MTESATAIYVRVSSRKQTEASQLPDLERWSEIHGPVQCYRDTFTGRTMDRPGWNELTKDMRAGLVSTIVVWRLDRLGRTAAGLTALFDELNTLAVNLISLKDGIDLSTPAGRLMANVIASVAQYDNEVRMERSLAGQAAARAAGKTWGGWQKGKRRKVTPQQLAAIGRMREAGVGATDIARTTGLARRTIYNLLEEMVPA